MDKSLSGNLTNVLISVLINIAIIVPNSIQISIPISVLISFPISNGAELGGATGAMAPLVFSSQSLKKSRKVSKWKSRSLEWHQLFLPSFGANVNYICIIVQ